MSCLYLSLFSLWSRVSENRVAECGGGRRGVQRPSRSPLSAVRHGCPARVWPQTLSSPPPPRYQANPSNNVCPHFLRGHWNQKVESNLNSKDPPCPPFFPHFYFLVMFCNGTKTSVCLERHLRDWSPAFPSSRRFAPRPWPYSMSLWPTSSS